MASPSALPSLTQRQNLLLAAVMCRNATGSYQRRLVQLRRRNSRRKVQLMLLLTTVLMCAMNTWMPREVWSYRRSSMWWEEIVCNTFTEQDWIENFRVSRETFLYICAQLQHKIVKCDTRFRQAISVQKRVAITLRVLATPCEYRSVAHLFGLARCTVCRIVHDTCKAIVKVLLPKYINFPTGDWLSEVVQGFLKKNGGFCSVQDQLMGRTYQFDMMDMMSEKP